MRGWNILTIIFIVVGTIGLATAVVIAKRKSVVEIQQTHCDVPDTIIYPHGNGTFTCPDKSQNLTMEKDGYMTYIRCSCK